MVFVKKKHNFAPNIRKALVNEMLKQVKQEYIMFMKKCQVLKDMADKENNTKWVQLRIKNRF